MILIIGSNHDDVLYYESLLNDAHTETVFSLYTLKIGRIYNQEVGIISNVYTNYISSLLTFYLTKKYFIVLVINVGTCIGFSPSLKQFEIAFSSEVTLANVDQTGLRKVRLGQIPSFPQFFETNHDLKNFLLPLLNDVNRKPYQEVTYYSSNVFYHQKANLPFLQGEESFPETGHPIVFDCTYGGIALACYLNKVNCFSIKAVEAMYPTRIDYQDYKEILNVYSDIGKIVLATIGDIGRSDILTESAT